ncbi:MAG: inositol monophosphatase [Candidatus Eremiobacteraeota bacterium]|nr:inositol monophosphatase [Candidatus Eremiobacteraeota bacterium]MCW5868263.1 inositol monophosphatase [Candidatus Eremiobacteraeota bacterium]
MELQRWTEQAVEAAQRAGRIIRAAWLNGDTEVRYKGRFNPVTKVDLESQRLIREVLLTYNPTHDFLGEEGTPHESGSEFQWIVDPLDGTKNFAHGYPHFGVSIGLQYQERIVIGVVHDPVRGETFTACRGGGAFLAGRPIQVSSTDTLERALLVTGFGTATGRDYAIFQSFDEVSEGVRRDGSAALNLCYLACGRLDGYFQRNLWPWDVAAGVLLVEEAGGMVTDYGGGRFQLDGRQLLASNVHLHGDMVRRMASGNS